MFFQPPVGIEIIVLLAPEHSCESLAHDAGPVGVRFHGGRSHGVIELIRLLLTCFELGVELAEWISQFGRRGWRSGGGGSSAGCAH